jgi:hypothetical protein
MKRKAEKRTEHMGMIMTEGEHEKWHREHSEMTEDQHEAFLKGMGVSKEEDEAWHKKHRTRPTASERPGRIRVNPFAVGGAFLGYCVKQGWLIQEGKGRAANYYVTEEGESELRRFGVKFKK